MKGKQFLKILYIVGVLLFAGLFYNISMAASVQGIQGQLYSVINANNNPLANVIGNIVSIIRWVGIAILIGAIMVKGIKYVTASPEGKAEIKKEIIMLVVGVILLYGITKLADIIYIIVKQNEPNVLQ